jgi:hypothetical protein
MFDNRKEIAGDEEETGKEESDETENDEDGGRLEEAGDAYDVLLSIDRMMYIKGRKFMLSRIQNKMSQG